MREALNRHFEKCMTSIAEGLPEVAAGDLEDSGYDTRIDWTCYFCKVKNKGTDNRCTNKGCGHERPKLAPLMKKTSIRAEANLAKN